MYNAFFSVFIKETCSDEGWIQKNLFLPPLEKVWIHGVMWKKEKKGKKRHFLHLDKSVKYFWASLFPSQIKIWLWIHTDPDQWPEQMNWMNGWMNEWISVHRMAYTQHRNASYTYATQYPKCGAFLRLTLARGTLRMPQHSYLLKPEVESNEWLSRVTESCFVYFTNFLT